MSGVSQHSGAAAGVQGSVWLQSRGFFTLSPSLLSAAFLRAAAEDPLQKAPAPTGHQSQPWTPHVRHNPCPAACPLPVVSCALSLSFSHFPVQPWLRTAPTLSPASLPPSLPPTPQCPPRRDQSLPGSSRPAGKSLLFLSSPCVGLSRILPPKETHFRKEKARGTHREDARPILFHLLADLLFKT